MRAVFARAASYAGGALAVLLIWEFFTLQLPGEPPDDVWRTTVVIHGLTVAAVSLIALVGGVVAFAALGAARVALLRVAMVGAIIGWPLGALFVALGVSTGFLLATAAALALAGIAAYVGARLIGEINAA